MTYFPQLSRAIRSSGLRMTSQRKAILEVIENSQEHLDAENIHAILKSRDLRIGLATVYRTVDLLKKVGLVSEHHLGEVHGHFETTSEDPHHHFTCLECGRVIEFKIAQINRLVQDLAGKMDIRVSEIQLLIRGYCPSCRVPSGKRS